MSEQARKIEHEAIPEWAEGLYYSKGSSPKRSSTTTTRPSTSRSGARTVAWCASRLRCSKP
jgi:hypothetical protein